MTLAHHGLRLIYALVLWSLSITLQAATVVSVDPQGMIEVDNGGDVSFRKGVLVCFFNAQQKPVACGVIQSVEDSSTQILVRPDFVSRVTAGMTAKLAPAKLQPGAKPAAPAAGAAQKPAPAASATKLLATPPQDPKKTGGTWSVTAGGFFIPVHLVNFQAVSYAAPIIRDVTPASLGTVETLWNSEQEVKKNLRGAYGLEIGYRNDWEFKLGLRTILLGNYNFQSNYDLERRPDDTQRLLNFADTSMSGQDYGLALDLYPFHTSSGTWYLSLGGGFDFSQSRLLMEMKKVDDVSGAEIVLAQYTSTIKALSLRLLSSTGFQFGNWNLGLGIYLLWPVQATIDTMTTVSDPQMSKYLASKDGKTDIDTAIAHDLSTYSIQTFLNLGYHF